jgi:hypothetical protein
LLKSQAIVNDPDMLERFAREGEALRQLNHLKLLKHKIRVLNCASFDLPEYVQIVTRMPKDNAKLLQVIKQVLS